MEKFKGSIKKRTIRLSVVLVIFLAILVYFAVTSQADSFAQGFQTGIAFAVLLITGRGLIRYIAALRDPEKLKKLYVYENDERNKFVAAKANASAMTVGIVVLYIAAAIAASYNMTVFYTLLSVVGFMAFMLLGFKLYYRSKY